MPIEYAIAFLAMVRSNPRQFGEQSASEGSTMGNTSPESTFAKIEACRRTLEKRSRLDGVYGRPLALLLGYNSVRSYQRAALNGTLPKVPLRPIPGQKGRYALAADLAAWVIKRAESMGLASWEQLVDKAFSTPPARYKEKRIKISEA